MWPTRCCQDDSMLEAGSLPAGSRARGRHLHFTAQSYRASLESLDPSVSKSNHIAIKKQPNKQAKKLVWTRFYQLLLPECPQDPFQDHTYSKTQLIIVNKMAKNCNQWWFFMLLSLQKLLIWQQTPLDLYTGDPETAAVWLTAHMSRNEQSTSDRVDDWPTFSSLSSLLSHLHASLRLIEASCQE